MPLRSDFPALAGTKPFAGIEVDVVFPVMHGPLCEDGTIQGLLELADIPYVGSSVLASAVGMDKEVAKRLVRKPGSGSFPRSASSKNHGKKIRATADRVEKKLGYPVSSNPRIRAPASAFTK